MKEYPSIPGPGEVSNFVTNAKCIGFRKYDGSNLRFSWSPKRGWYKFGTRNRTFDVSDVEYGCSVALFKEKYGSGLEKVFVDDPFFKKATEVICYAEFFGPNSFCGQHDPVYLGVEHNDPKDIILFDVNVHKKGLIPAWQFMDTFGHLPVAQVVYEGVMDDELVERVAAGEFAVDEGMVCKGMVGRPPHGLWMRKIKTRQYLERLKKWFASGHGEKK